MIVLTTPKSKFFVLWYGIAIFAFALIESVVSNVEFNSQSLDTSVAIVSWSMLLASSLAMVSMCFLIYRKYPGAISVIEWNPSKVVVSVFVSAIFMALVLLSVYNSFDSIVKTDYISLVKAASYIPVLVWMRSFAIYLSGLR